MWQGLHSGDAGENLPVSSPSEVEMLDAMIAGLADLDADHLRLQWRNHLGGTAPAHLPRWLLLRALAYRLQAAALGDLDKATLRIIRASQGDAIDSAVTRPFNNRKPRTRDGIGLNAGALLVREWKGKLERVMVLDMGFAWSGKTFGSLSQVAKAITGTSWNGHRFFGLRSVKDQASEERAGRSNADENRRCGADQSKNLRREASKGSGRRQTERPIAKTKCPGTRLAKRRISIPNPEPRVLPDGESRQNIADVSP
jgi:Protein of unknown function (DUF2924)